MCLFISIKSYLISRIRSILFPYILLISKGSDIAYNSIWTSKCLSDTWESNLSNWFRDSDTNTRKVARNHGHFTWENIRIFHIIIEHLRGADCQGNTTIMDKRFWNLWKKFSWSSNIEIIEIEQKTGESYWCRYSTWSWRTKKRVSDSKKRYICFECISELTNTNNCRDIDKWEGIPLSYSLVFCNGFESNLINTTFLTLIQKCEDARGTTYFETFWVDISYAIILDRVDDMEINKCEQKR